MEILVATSNKNKLAELSHIASKFGVSLLTPKVLKERLNLGDEPKFEEVFDTYSENALLKAREYFLWSNFPTLADDSGLEVEALGGAPGVRSARYGGDGLDDRGRVSFLLAELNKINATRIQDRKCRYVCNLVFLSKIEEIAVESSVSGIILESLRGDSGFGYDPVFFIESISKTMAEVDISWTYENGFRAKAAKEIFPKILEKMA